jgi:hypothetical protein
MDKIPISFTHNGKHYSGHFANVQGAGDTRVWHLYNDKNYYLGRLRYSTFTSKWVFDSSQEDLSSLAQFFAKHVAERSKEV